MPEATQPDALDPALAASLTDFARACKAALRAVSLYPAAHPAIKVALDHLTETAARATAGGSLDLQIRPDSIRIGGAEPAKPDPAISELAGLLHRHLVGGLTLQRGTDVDSWRALLQLLTRAPEDVRGDGGIGHLWAAAGGPSLEIFEIDYAEVLRERGTGEAAIDDIIEACAHGKALAECDQATRDAMKAIVAAPTQLRDLVERLELRVAGQDADSKSTAFLSLLRQVAEQVQASSPDQFDSVFTQLAHGAAGLPADTLAGVLRRRNSPDAVTGDFNVVGAIVERMSDEAIVGFVARTVIAERSPTQRLAEAFQALVPEGNRRHQLLSLAGDRVSRSPLADEDSFEGLWARVETMLTSYSDAAFVSDEYALELSGTRSMAVEVDHVRDDPPERIAVWLSTVSDGSIRSLDLQLLLDLLQLEGDPARWRDVAETVITHVEDLARLGLVEQACQLADAVAKETEDSTRRPHATRALERLGDGSLIKHAAAQLRGVDDLPANRVKRVCHAIGPSIIPALAEVLSTEQDARARARLREILVGYGPSGREAIQALLAAPNWQVRRTAAFLLHEFGGTESLDSLESLLCDLEPLVQREAIQGFILDGSESAFSLLRTVLTTCAPRVRASLVRELATMHDERAAPLFCHLVKNLSRRRLRSAYEVSIDALGACGGTDALEALAFALRQGEWWAPFRTRALRTRAATALRRIGTPDAIQVLREVANHGPRSTRRAARVALTGMEGR